MAETCSQVQWLIASGRRAQRPRPWKLEAGTSWAPLGRLMTPGSVAISNIGNFRSMNDFSISEKELLPLHRISVIKCQNQSVQPSSCCIFLYTPCTRGPSLHCWGEIFGICYWVLIWIAISSLGASLHQPIWVDTTSYVVIVCECCLFKRTVCHAPRKEPWLRHTCTYWKCCGLLW